METNSEEKNRDKQVPSNEDQQGVDKAPGEERAKGEQVTNDDLKGKKVDRDITRDTEQPIRQLP